jgi:hypothetical protein
MTPLQNDVHLFLFSYISNGHLPATHRTDGCLFVTQTNKSNSIDLITTLVARGQGVELQYKAGERMSLRHTAGVQQVINNMGAGYTRDKETRTVPSKI